MSPGQTGHITGQMGRVPGTDGTHTRDVPPKFFMFIGFFFPNFGVSQKGSPERCRCRFFPFFPVFFHLFPFLSFLPFSSVFSIFFRFFPFHFQKKNGETPFARPLLRNPDNCLCAKCLCAFSSPYHNEPRTLAMLPKVSLL